MTIYKLIQANLPLMRLMHRNGVSGSYVQYLPIYEDYKRLVAEGNKVRWVAQHIADKYGYTERYVRLIVKMMEEQAQ